MMLFVSLTLAAILFLLFLLLQLLRPTLTSSTTIFQIAFPCPLFGISDEYRCSLRYWCICSRVSFLILFTSYYVPLISLG